MGPCREANIGSRVDFKNVAVTPFYEKFNAIPGMLACSWFKRRAATKKSSETDSGETSYFRDKRLRTRPLRAKTINSIVLSRYRYGSLSTTVAIAGVGLIELTNLGTLLVVVCDGC